ncbi:hypothetical protein EJV47_11225 [Hymenobacter gummosus]|uniref:Uncharacterized protein n=1 Tax=Hymenobacter gummosus TaxID=1776032 RepID=A0A3S0H9U8_9BACT|nr:hypothetical protein [Hymenobacter gummosus]RTQ50198.1 hypothetical protein EJV47_11225 [Hymenobacter gummosus]
MPHLPTPLHTALREAVAARFGQPLRYPSHCDALEQQLQRTAATGGRRLSPSTLRRFFGLVHKQGGYHLHTLDTLARYTGHADFAAFGRAVAALAAAPPAPTAAAPDIPELLGMAQLAYPERLLLGYFLGRVTRPAAPTGPAAPLALRLAAHPAGQEFFVESFVDLASLNGAYGELLREYLRHKPTPEAQLFGHCTLFLGEFLGGDEPAWRQRLKQLLALPCAPGLHAFPQGRRAFAQLVAAWYDAPDQPLPAALLAQVEQQAAQLPPVPSAPALPAFYNQFPAGYHFLVAEALFLAGQYPALGRWLLLTEAAVPEALQLEHNVYTELLRAFDAVARCRTGQPATRPPGLAALFALDTHAWLLDYYQVHLWLVELHFAPDASTAAAWQARVADFAQRHHMPFFARVARAIPPPYHSGISSGPGPGLGIL